MLSTKVIFWMSDKSALGEKKQPTLILFPIAISPNSVIKCIFFPARQNVCQAFIECV